MKKVSFLSTRDEKKSLQEQPEEFKLVKVVQSPWSYEDVHGDEIASTVTIFYENGIDKWDKARKKKGWMNI